MAFLTQSPKTLEGFNLHRASAIAHFSLAIGARFHELDGPGRGHTIPLTILTSLDTRQQNTVRELVHRARHDSVMGRIIGTFIRGTLSERLGVCVIKRDKELLYAARVLKYQIDHLQYYYEIEPAANGNLSQDRQSNIESHHASAKNATHFQGNDSVQRGHDSSKTYLDYDGTATQESQVIYPTNFSRDGFPITQMQQNNFDAWMEAEDGGEHLVEKLKYAAATDLSRQDHFSPHDYSL